MLDWNYIKTTFPNSIDLLRGKYDVYFKDTEPQYGILLEYDCAAIWDNRDLYDIFDNEGIYIAIIKDNAFGNEVHNGLNDIYFENKDWFDNRIEAENEAYLKAFELLEHKLTQ